jgi:hypothetical protein
LKIFDFRLQLSIATIHTAGPAEFKIENLQSKNRKFRHGAGSARFEIELGAFESNVTFLNRTWRFEIGLGAFEIESGRLQNRKSSIQKSKIPKGSL